MLVSAKFGIDFSVFCPKELRPDDEIRTICQSFAAESGARIEIGDAADIVKNADCFYTDVWVSMGEESLQSERIKLLSPFQVNRKLMDAAGKSGAVFMHCLPAVKGQEVTEEVFESAASRVWEQAENRKHSIKAILLAVI